jgi:hypothetical protein
MTAACTTAGGNCHARVQVAWHHMIRQCRHPTHTTRTCYTRACRKLNSSNDHTDGLDIVHEGRSEADDDETGELHS